MGFNSGFKGLNLRPVNGIQIAINGKETAERLIVYRELNSHSLKF